MGEISLLQISPLCICHEFGRSKARAGFEDYTQSPTGGRLILHQLQTFKIVIATQLLREKSLIVQRTICTRHGMIGKW